MNKFLSIFAATGLLAAFAGAAQAETAIVTPVSVVGTATSVCNLTVQSTGSLAGNNTNPTKIGTTWGVAPTLQTICNSGGHKVEVSRPVFTLANAAGPVTIPGDYIISGGFGGGAGVYLAMPSEFNTNLTTAFETEDTTSNGGDKFNVLARIESPTTSLLIAGTYTAAISVTLTPQ